MPAESESHREFIGIVPTLLLATTAVFGYLTLQPPLTSSRPPSLLDWEPPTPPSPPGMYAKHARLWQDPLSVAATHQSASSSAHRDSQSSNSPVWTTLSFHNSEGETFSNDKRVSAHFEQLVNSTPTAPEQPPCTICLPVFLPGSPYADDQEQRIRVRYAVLAGLASHGYTLKYPDRMSYVQLPIVINIRSGNDLREIPLTVPVKLFEKSPTDSNGISGPTRLLVLWINESQLGGRPLAALGQILHHLFPDPKLKKKIRLAVLGPTNSNTLLAMIEEFRHWSRGKGESDTHSGLQRANAQLTTERRCHYQDVIQCANFFGQFYSDDSSSKHSPHFLNQPLVFSPRATVDASTLSALDRCALHNFSLASGHSSVKPSCGLRLVRTIGTDRSLIEKLRTELKYRDAWPDTERPRNALVLLAEQDTLYGRHFCETLKRELQQHDSVHIQTHLHIIHYLRGIDGRIPGQKADESRKNVDNDTKLSAPSENARFDLPQGTAQLDYLRRIQDQVVRMKDQLRKNNRRVAAIGIVGTDLYDKLLILRALRKQFPDVIFFTTDVDARYSHTSEYDHCRNLIVASHFGLELNESLQGTTPPFRDSYQSAYYFSVRYLLNDPALFDVPSPTKGRSEGSPPATPLSRDDPWHLTSSLCSATTPPGESGQGLQPLVFEISRHGPYQLTRHTDMSSMNRVLHPRSPRELSLWSASDVPELLFKLLALFVLFAMVYVILWLIASGRLGGSGRRREILNLWGEWGVALTAVILALLCAKLASDYNFQWWHWSATATTLVGTLLVSSTISPVRKALQGLGTFSGTTVLPLVILYLWLAGMIVVHFWENGEPLEWNYGISLWPVTSMRALAGVIAFFALVDTWRILTKALKDDFAKAAGIDCTSETNPFARWRERLRIKGLFDLHDYLSERSDEDLDAVTKLCEDYCEWSMSVFFRAIPLALATFAATFAVFGVDDLFRLPFRGTASWFASILVLYVAGLLLLVLLFFIIDAIQLTRRFTRDVAKRRQAWDANSKSGIHQMAQRRGRQRTGRSASISHNNHWKRDPLNDLFTIRIIARQTRTVGKLIKWPFIVILVFLLARQKMFDNLGFPIPLAVMTFVIGIALVVSIFNLRIAARKAREDILRRLDEDLARAREQNADRAEKAEKRVQTIIDEVRRERSGAFTPWTHDPLFSALLIPFSGASGILIIESIMRRFY